jgi:hypothetical protein
MAHQLLKCTTNGERNRWEKFLAIITSQFEALGLKLIDTHPEKHDGPREKNCQSMLVTNMFDVTTILVQLFANAIEWLGTIDRINYNEIVYDLNFDYDWVPFINLEITLYGKGNEDKK